jgi:hypothetical protein
MICKGGILANLLHDIEGLLSTRSITLQRRALREEKKGMVGVWGNRMLPKYVFKSCKPDLEQE